MILFTRGVIDRARFLIHGKEPEVIEGPFPGMVVIAEGVPEGYRAASLVGR